MARRSALDPSGPRIKGGGDSARTQDAANSRKFYVQPVRLSSATPLSFCVGVPGDPRRSSRQWASLPVRPMIDGEGRAPRYEKGRIRYSQLAGWRTKELANKFSQLAIAALLEKHPSAIDGVEP